MMREKELERAWDCFGNLFTGLSQYSEIHFSKGYKEYEYVYEELKKKEYKNNHHLKREEIDHLGWTEVVITLD